MSKNSSIVFSVYVYCKASDNNTNKLALNRRVVDDTEEAATLAAAAAAVAAPKHLITKNQIDKTMWLMIIDSVYVEELRIYRIRKNCAILHVAFHNNYTDK